MFVVLVSIIMVVIVVVVDSLHMDQDGPCLLTMFYELIDDVQKNEALSLIAKHPGR